MIGARNVVVAEVDADLIETVRASLPSLADHRDDVFSVPFAVQGS